MSSFGRVTLTPPSISQVRRQIRRRRDPASRFPSPSLAAGGEEIQRSRSRGPIALPSSALTVAQIEPALPRSLRRSNSIATRA